MPHTVNCGACHASFAIPDDIWDRRVRGRVATLKCRSCKAEIRVDGSKDSKAPAPAPAPAATMSATATPVGLGQGEELLKAALAAASGPKTAAPATKTEAQATKGPAAAEKPAVAPAPTAAAKAAAPPAVRDDLAAEDLWAVSFGDDDDRELTESGIAAELATGSIGPATLVWREGMPEWLTLAEVPKLASHLPRLPKKEPAVPATKKPNEPAATASPARPMTLLGVGTPAAPVTRPQEPPVTAPLTRPMTLLGVGTPTAPAAKPASSPKAAATTPATPKAAPKGPAEPPAPKAAVELAAQHTAKGETAPREMGSKPKAGPPAAPRRSMESKEELPVPPPLPWEAPRESQELFTSAPPVVVRPDASAPKAVPPAPIKAPSVDDPPTLPQVAAPPVVEQPRIPTVRPQKPTTSRTLVTDEDFMAIQRRFPKWALPAAIGGAVVLVGLIILGSSGESETLVTEEKDAGPLVTDLARERARKARETSTPVAPLPAAVASGAQSQGPASEADFAKAFAVAAGKRESGGFDENLTRQALEPTLKQAQTCHYKGDPTGNASVSISVNGAGQVLSTDIAAPFGKTPTGDCISKHLRAARLPRFKGAPGRLVVSVPIR